MKGNEQDEAAQSPATVEFPVDCDALGPARCGGCLIGYVEEMHGPEAALCAFRPTRFEARVLARHWAEARLDMALDRFYYAQIASEDLRRDPYAAIRLGQIAEAIGEGPVREEKERAEEQARLRMGPERWKGFRHGTPGDWSRAAEEAHHALHEVDPKCEDEAGWAAAWAYLRANPQSIYLDEDRFLWCLAADTWTPGATGERLLLRVTSPRGVSGFVPGCEMQRPADWTPPYGLH